MYVEEDWSGGSICGGLPSDLFTNTSTQGAITFNSHYQGFTLDDGYNPNDGNSHDYVMRKNYEIIGLDGGESFYVKDDGTGDGANDLDVSNNWTFEAWIYVKNYTSGNYDCIMDRRTVFSFYLIDDDKDYAIAFAARDGSDNIIAYMDCDGTGSTSADMQFNNWYHVAATYDGSTAKLYVNGTEMDSDTDTDWNLTSSTNALNIGGRYWGSYSRQMESAYLDEIRISNIARTTSELHYNKTDNAYMVDDHTILLMHLDDEGDPPTYLSGTGYNGTKGDDGITAIDYIDATEESDFLPFPVELTSFTTNVSGSNIQLNWQTATEINNYGFEIQRATENYDWQKIGFVEGAGNSNSPEEYSFSDKLVKSGKYYYRLKQIDLNGSYKYSNTVEVIIGAPEKFELSQNYPNPFNPTTNITYVIARSEATRQSHELSVKLTVYDILGRKVATLVNKKQAPGNYSVQFDASKLSSGIYFYTLRAGEFTDTKKMILMK